MDALNLMAAEFFEEDRKIGFPGANKQAIQRLEKAWTTLEDKLAVISGAEAVHRLAEWGNKQFGVVLNAVKLAKELARSEIAEEIHKVLTAIEQGEPFP